MTKDEALKLALEGITKVPTLNGVLVKRSDVEAAIKEALAEPEQDGECKHCTDGCPACDARKLPEQEPVAFASHGVVNWIADKQFQHEALLYSAPQRTWVGLTYEEQRELYKKHDMDGWGHFYNAIEAKLKEKNT